MRARASLALAQLFERIGLAAFALALVFALALGACSSVPPGFSTIAPRVVERAEYGRCLEAGGKIEAQGVQIALLSSACVLAMDAGSSAPAAASSSSETPAASSELEGKDASASDVREEGDGP